MDTPQPDDPRSPYLRIVEDLRRSIALGQIEPGGKLPSNADLKRRYTVASQTAQNAINELKNEGLVYGIAGKGVYVRTDVDLDSIRSSIQDSSTSDEAMREVLARVQTLEDKVSQLEQKLSSESSKR